MSRLTGILLATMVLTAVGCASSRREVVIDTAGQRNEWVTADKDQFEREGKYYFRATLTEQKSLDRALDIARFQAMAKISESVSSRVMTAFAQTSTGASNYADDPSAGSVGSATQREIAAASRALLTGVIPESSYWEKISATSPQGEEQVSYKVFALVSIPRTSYQRALLAGTESGINAARRQNNEAALTTLSENLRALKAEMGQ